MICRNCGKEVAEGVTECHYCREPVTTTTGLSADPQPVPAPISGPTLPTMPSPEPAPKVGKITYGIGKSDDWRPKMERVRDWIDSVARNHYAVLELPVDASDSALQFRVAALEQMLETWALAIEAPLQQLSSAGKKVYRQLIADLNDRPAYNRDLVKRLRESNLSQFVDDFKRFTKGSLALSPQARWKLLIENARKHHLSHDELNQAVQKLKQREVITAIDIEGHEVRTLEELKVICHGQAKLLASVFEDETLELWLQHIADEPEQAAIVRLLRSQHSDAPIVGARKWLQLIADGVEPVSPAVESSVAPPPLPQRLERPPAVVRPPSLPRAEPRVPIEPKAPGEAPKRGTMHISTHQLAIAAALVLGALIVGYQVYSFLLTRPPEPISIPLYPSELIINIEAKEFKADLRGRVCKMVENPSLYGLSSDATQRNVVTLILKERDSLASIAKKAGKNIPTEIAEVTDQKVEELISGCGNSNRR